MGRMGELHLDCHPETPVIEPCLLLDLGSCERALLAIPFFDKHLSRKLVELVNAEIVNELFPLTRFSHQFVLTKNCSKPLGRRPAGSHGALAEGVGVARVG